MNILFTSLDLIFTGEEHDEKRTIYEPNQIERCKQIICTQRWAIVIAVTCAALIFSIAIIAALTRAPCQHDAQSLITDNEVTTQLMVMTEKNKQNETSGNISNFPWKDLRLPKTIKPLSYKIFLHPNLTTLQYAGRVTMQVKFLESSDFLVFHHAEEIEVHTHHAYLTSSRVPVPIIKTLYNKEHEQRYIRFSSHVDKGTLIDLKVTFASVLATGMSGFYISHYKNAKGEKR